MIAKLLPDAALTVTMKAVLGRLARCEMANATAGTLKALESRGLIIPNTEPDDGRGWRNVHMLTAAGRSAIGVQPPAAVPELADVATTSRSVDAYLSREYPALFPAAAAAEPENPCRLRDCTGSWHGEDICDAILAELPTQGATLIAEVSVEPEKTPELVVWEGNDGRDLIRTHDGTAAAQFADRLRALAAAVDKGANLLTPAATSEPVDHAARFAALDAEVLFALEGERGDMGAPQSYIESLLIVLAEWRPRVVAMLADAPEWAVPEAAQYRRALDRTREAWTQYSFRWEGGPDLPYPFDLPQSHPQPSPAARVARITSAGRRSLTVREVAA